MTEFRHFLDMHMSGIKNFAIFNREIKTAFIVYTTGGGGGVRRVWLGGGVLTFFEGKSGDGKNF